MSFECFISLVMLSDVVPEHGDSYSLCIFNVHLYFLIYYFFIMDPSGLSQIFSQLVHKTLLHTTHPWLPPRACDACASMPVKTMLASP